MINNNWLWKKNITKRLRFKIKNEFKLSQQKKIKNDESLMTQTNSNGGHFIMATLTSKQMK